MIVSETSNRSNSRWMQTCVLLCAMVVLPVGVAYAQDCGAVEKRLGKAVSEGELSLKQAVVMMDALKNVAKNDDNGVEDQLKAVGERIKAAVKAGKFSEKEAWAKWHEIKERIIKGAVDAGKMSREKAGALWREIEKAEIGERLKAAVAKGEMTEKEALAKWAAINKEGGPKGVDGHKRITPEDMEGAGIEIRKAVADGKITPEQGRSMMEDIRKQGERHCGGEHKRITPEDLERAGPEIRKAVAAGKITPQQGRAKMEAMRKMLGEQGERGAKKDAPRKITREDYARAGTEIRKAVAAGRISPEQGRARMGAMRKMLGGQGERSEKAGEAKRGTPDWGAIKRRIEGAVKSGKMTREEANKHYAEIKKGMASKGKANADLDAIWKKLQAMVKAGKMTEEQAHAKMTAIKREAAAKAKAR